MRRTQGSARPAHLPSLPLCTLSLCVLPLGLLSCEADAPKDTGGIGGDETLDAVELTMPDLTGIDLEATFDEAILIATHVNTSIAWGGHTRSLSRRHEGCPDFYVGVPEDFAEDYDLPEEDAPGTVWADNCTTPGGLFYRGMVYWDGRGQISGDAETAEGRTESGTRQLAGAGTVGDAEDNRFQFRGTATDALSRVVAPGYERWTYSSTVSGTVTGDDAHEPVASLTPGGWRADLYLSAVGGAAVGDVAQQLEARGDVYMFEHRIADRFDSVSLDLNMVNEAAAGPDDCALEPRGWIGVRDENAWWFDVVFMPLAGTDATGDTWYDPARSVCDGCGSVYIRGVEAESIGEICPDFAGIWERGVMDAPAVEDYVFTIRSLEDQ
jgi:hypothetical protein